MAKTPFYKVSIRNTNNPADDRDITNYISRVTYEDAVDVDNMLTLEIRTNAMSLLDDHIFSEGSILTFQFGFLKGKISPNFVMRLANIMPNYGPTVSMTIQATDLGLVLKKRESKKDWKNYKASDIANEIATYYGLKAVVENTDAVHAFMPQGGKTDYNFLKYLAKIQKSGSWRFYIKNDTLYFTRLKLEQDSFKTYTYNDGDSVISFRPYSRETAKSNAARDTVVTSVDPFTNKPVQKVVNDTTSKDDVKLGDYAVHVYDGDAKEISSPSKTTGQKRPSQVQAAKSDPNRAGSHLFNPSGDDTEIENFGNAEKKDKANEEYMAELEIEGDPDILSDIVVTMAGVSKRDIGNWYVSRAKHILTDDGGYTLTTTMRKNATQKAGTADNNQQLQDTNKTVGNKNAETKKDVGVYTYDENAKLVSSPTSK